MMASFWRVFRRPRYVMIAFFMTWLVFSFIMWLPNRALIVNAFATSLPSGFSIMWLLYGGIVTNFMGLSGLTVVLFSLLAGVQASLLTFYIQTHQVKATFHRRIQVLGVGGIVASMFGIGCAACGSLIAAVLVSSLGAGALLLWLPLHGAEFGLLGVVLLLVACYYLLRAISHPAVCPVE